MKPMLRQGRDKVVLTAVTGKLKKYDLPVYRRRDGKYVMHRVVAVKEGYCICLGDNTLTFEKIHSEQMIGVVSAFKRGDKRIEVDAFGYRIYCHFWRLTHPFRKLLYRGKSMFYRLVKPFRKDKD